MTTLSVPLRQKHEELINELVKSGYAPNKAEVMRRALERLAEEEAVQAVLRAEQELADGKILRGDLKELAKKIH